MRNRTNQILIRLNDAEFAQYQKRRKRTGKSGNAFCLACLLNHPIRTVENLPEILRQLKAIGNNLNVVVQGNNNVVIVNSRQVNNGNVNAGTSLNGTLRLP